MWRQRWWRKREQNWAMACGSRLEIPWRLFLFWSRYVQSSLMQYVLTKLEHWAIFWVRGVTSAIIKSLSSAKFSTRWMMLVKRQCSPRSKMEFLIVRVGQKSGMASCQIDSIDNCACGKYKVNKIAKNNLCVIVFCYAVFFDLLECLRGIYNFRSCSCWRRSYFFVDAQFFRPEKRGPARCLAHRG